MPNSYTELSSLISQNLMFSFSTDETELYKKLLDTFRDSISKGNSALAQDTLVTFTQSFSFNPFETLVTCQNFLTYFNTICHLQLFSTDVHPSYTLKLYDNFSQKILNIIDTKQALPLAKDICHKYSLLVKNYSLSNYSKHIRTVISYIHLHLEEDLTLRILADLVEKNASALSSSFSKEVGMTVTQYIHQTRIEKAVFYFNATNMSVSEVSLAVGIHDFAYFSRLFHNQIGCSPREYMKQMMQTDTTHTPSRDAPLKNPS